MDGRWFVLSECWVGNGLGLVVMRQMSLGDI